ncbi:unnamed protein product, partial [Didymodactylos carnosus]
MMTRFNPTFLTYSPAFRGLTTANGKITDSKRIVKVLADFYETHFKEPKFDLNNPSHRQSIEIKDQLDYCPNIPVQRITYKEVEDTWKKLQPKKSLDSVDTSSFLLKNLPREYMSIITVLFNKCAEEGTFFNASKHAKIICLSKDGLYPEEHRLRPSLLPNIGKWMERIMHQRILKWCEQNNIYVDEQSGFTLGRRLQTRILSLTEELRITTAANNRPALVIFVDFLSAFDKMWFPALMKNLIMLDMPLDLVKWIYSWLNGRTMSVYHGDEVSRTIQIFVGAPQGSILAATLFRLHVHFLPKSLVQSINHLFADDLAIVLQGSLDKRFSENIIELENLANKILKQLEKFADD